MKEYIYIDQKRLDIYFDQVSSQKFIYEKIPFWKVGLSVIGPVAEGQQQRVQREFTPREKISKVLEHLEKNDLLKRRRPRHHEHGVTDAPVFRMDTCDAIRMEIQGRRISTRQGIRDFPGLSFWLSGPPDPPRPPETSTETKVLDLLRQAGWDAPEKEGPLFLMLNDAAEDELGLGASSYSAFQMLRDYAGEFLPLIVLPGGLESEDAVREFDRRLAINPARYLELLGARVTATRRITTLYRVRHCFNVAADQPRGYVTLTFGYPICIEV